MHASYNSEDIKSVALLAHEYGHATHHLLRQEQLSVPTTSIIFTLILLSLCFMLSVPTGFILLSVVFTFIIVAKNKFQFTTLKEGNADVLAIQMIENIYGIDYARNVAEYLLGLRIFFLRNATSQMESNIANNCIKNLTYFITSEKRIDLIKKCALKIKSLHENTAIDSSEKKRKILYKHFQITSHIWLNSLNHKQSESLSDYIDTNLKSDKNFLEKPFKDEGYKKMVINDNRLVYNVPLAIDFTNKTWNIPTAISDLVFYAHCISYEFYNFANNFDLLKKELKSRKKQQWIQLFSDIAGIAAKLHRFT